MVDIVDIYAQAGVLLVVMGDRWHAPCPFHEETKPSFVVYPDGGYHCFGCGAHGTLQDMGEYAGVDFIIIPDLAYEQDHTEVEIKKYLKKVEKSLLSVVQTWSNTQKIKMFDKFDDMYGDCVANSRDVGSSLVSLISYIRKVMGKELFS